MLSPPLGGHKALDTVLRSALFQECDKGNAVRAEGADQLWTRYAAPGVCLFQNKVMFLLKIMLIYDDPLLSSQPPISGHLPVPQGLGLMEVQLHTGI